MLLSYHVITAKLDGEDLRMAGRPKLTGKPRAKQPLPMKAEPKADKPQYVRGSLYLHPAIHEALRKLAFDQRRSQHDLWLEGIDVVLERYTGRNINDLIG